ncbi:MAG: DUF1538 family protein, partial [Erysipelotrichia bacterium]|nr:DUF1538 family protein [Erysipelotrichia bacterium]
MKLLNYLKEVFLSSLPLLAIIVIVTVFAFPLIQPSGYLQIGIGYLLVVFGQAVFLAGLDSSILTIGNLVGGSLVKLNKIVFVLLFGFLFGLLATLAEPAIHVIARQVDIIADNVNYVIFIFVIGFSTGIAVAFAIYRIIKNIDVRLVFLILYLLIFGLVFFVPEQYRALAFDSSGATTGAVSVPFILTLGLGISKTASKKKTADERFGIIGIVCACSIIGIFIYGLIVQAGPTNPYDLEQTNGLLQTLGSTFSATILAIVPIIAIFLIFQFLFIKLPKKKLITILLSSLIVFIGLFIFLFGIDYGFAFAGNYIGKVFVGDRASATAKFFLIPIGFVLGFGITLS